MNSNVLAILWVASAAIAAPNCCVFKVKNHGDFEVFLNIQFRAAGKIHITSMKIPKTVLNEYPFPVGISNITMEAWKSDSRDGKPNVTLFKRKLTVPANTCVTMWGPSQIPRSTEVHCDTLR